MSRWFRFYDCALDDPKVQRLPAELFKTWVNLLCVASRHDGKLPDADDLAFLLRMDGNAMRQQIESLEAHGLIDRNEVGTASPHNWDKRQHKSDDSAERVRRFREKQKQNANGSGNDDGNGPGNGRVTVTVTAPDTDTDTDTEKKKESSSADADTTASSEKKNGKITRLEYPGEFEMWWAEYPQRKGFSKWEAYKEWKRLSADLQDAALEGAIAFAEQCRTNRTDPQYIKHPCRWLKERRWETLLEVAQ